MLARITFHLGMALFASGSALALAFPAHADTKSISATECQPYYPTTPGQVILKNNAIFNAEDFNQRVMCPINKDAAAHWVNGKVQLTAYISAGVKSGKVACTLYGGGASYQGPLMAYTKLSSIVPPNTMTTMSITGVADHNQSLTMTGWNVLCTLNSGMSLGGFSLDEMFDTNE